MCCAQTGLNRIASSLGEMWLFWVAIEHAACGGMGTGMGVVYRERGINSYSTFKLALNIDLKLVFFCDDASFFGGVGVVQLHALFLDSRESSILDFYPSSIKSY